VAVPTETVYGLAGNAFDDNAVAKIFAAKERPSFDPLIVHLAAARSSITDLQSAGVMARELPGHLWSGCFEALTAAFWPGPLTILAPRGPKIPDLVTSGLPDVGLRVPAQKFTAALLDSLEFPLAAPSANRFGRISPTTAAAVSAELGDRIPLVIDGGPCAVGVESTVVRISESGAVTILRPGGVSREEIARLVQIDSSDSGSTATNPETSQTTAQLAPGMLASHYAPRARLVLLGADSAHWHTELSRAANLNNIRRVACLSCDATTERVFGTRETVERLLNSIPGMARVSVCEMASLSNAGSETEAARQLFATLRRLDDLVTELNASAPGRSAAQANSGGLIIAVRPRLQSGLWSAIADRLTRASVT